MSEEDILRLVREYCAEIYVVDLAAVTPRTTFVDDLESDSMSVLELRAALGGHGLDIDPSDCTMEMTVGDIARLAHRSYLARQTAG
ncbi:acyl carrier protein [Nonomuraea sp. NPDC050153]|uniref:acyl carrier protein n=1 Tax=Nonomuraea sp. NPDC050153 TaxID=3364359 RepID=UPI00379E6655